MESVAGTIEPLPQDSESPVNSESSQYPDLGKLLRKLGKLGLEDPEGFLVDLDIWDNMYDSVTDNSDWVEVYGAVFGRDPELVSHFVNPITAEIERHGITKEDLIHQVLYEGHVYSHGSFKSTASQKYGACYTFNTGSLQLKTHQARTLSGLHLLLDLQSEEYIHLLNPYVGAKIFLHSSNASFEETTPLIVTPGGIHDFTVDVITTVTEDGLCDPDQIDTYKTCSSKCVDDYIREYCDCSTEDNVDPVYRCTIYLRQQYVCKEAIIKLHSMGHLKCYSCKPDCRKVEYKIKHHTRGDWSEKYIEHLHYKLIPHSSPRRVSTTRIRDNFVQIHITLSDTATYHFVTVPFKIYDLAVYIGGAAAVLSGLSVIGFLEIFYIFWSMCTNRCKSSRSQANRVEYFDAIPGDSEAPPQKPTQRVWNTTDIPDDRPKTAPVTENNVSAMQMRKLPVKPAADIFLPMPLPQDQPSSSPQRKPVSKHYSQRQQTQVYERVLVSDRRQHLRRSRSENELRQHHPTILDELSDHKENLYDNLDSISVAYEKRLRKTMQLSGAVRQFGVSESRLNFDPELTPRDPNTVNPSREFNFQL